MKNIFYIIIIITFISSCYQAPESSSGSVAVRLNSDLMRDAPGDFDGELRLAVFDEGDLDSLIDYPVGAYPMIAYLGDFPTPLLANNSVPFYGSSGVLSMLNVPSDKPLKLLIEHYGERFDTESIYFHSYSGVSEEFEVPGGETTDVTVTLLPTAFAGGMSVNKHTSYIETSHFRLYDPADLDSIINFSGNTISSIDGGTTALNPYGTSGDISGNNAVVNFESADAILPGRKTRVLVSPSQNISTDDFIGISGEFELRPGLSDSVSVTYYQYTSCDTWNC